MNRAMKRRTTATVEANIIITTITMISVCRTSLREGTSLLHTPCARPRASMAKSDANCMINLHELLQAKAVSKQDIKRIWRPTILIWSTAVSKNLHGEHRNKVFIFTQTCNVPFTLVRCDALDQCGFLDCD